MSPDTHDKASPAAELQGAPRHDAISPDVSGQDRPARWWHMSHDRAEAGVQLLSRWAGPAVLALAIAAIGWWIFG
ncbi:hypothetical protein L288_02720 [Sphingobium quisquiliarum P25]|uniref:Uncharacterized protein n=1 Tax=Sphingobium quisquiliarum P25 TaxID=1329909 RepID=T0IRL3_9SPHN|nr:hypothetical protein L288_02720 [Sphingobium quisquiliarum P25]